MTERTDMILLTHYFCDFNCLYIKLILNFTHYFCDFNCLLLLLFVERGILLSELDIH
jgi:hypothetical protein